MNRTDILNFLIKNNNYKNYLEIGVEEGINFEAIQLAPENKIGVDPDKKSKANVLNTSDEFFIFAKKIGLKFDIAWIDGLHVKEQVIKDIENALDCLNDGGIVCAHDMLPINEIMQRPVREQDIWTGNCWQAFVELRKTRSDLEMYVVNTDWGVAIIRKNSQILLDTDLEINYENFLNNKQDWMNIKSIDEFIKKETK